MSIQALNWAFNMQIKPGPRFVLVVLANYADANQSCYPTYDLIAKKTGIAERTIGQHLAYLEDVKLISRARQRYPDGNFGNYRYTLHTQISRVVKPPADLRKTTRRFAQNHPQISRVNIRKNKPKDKTKGKNAFKSEFERLKSFVEPVIQPDRFDEFRSRKALASLPDEFDLVETVDAIIAYYKSKKSDAIKFRPALHRVIEDKKFQSFIGSKKSLPVSIVMDVYDRQAAGEFSHLEAQAEISRLEQEGYAK